MNYLKMLRLQRGHTQAQMAERLAIHEVTYNRLENGWFARPPTGVESNLQRVFGRGWTFGALMEPVPRPSAPALNGRPQETSQ